MCYQARDVLEAMAADFDAESTEAAVLRMDGGAVRNDYLCQFQADLLGAPVMRPTVEETTAIGAAFAAGLATGVWSGIDELRELWRPGQVFEPRIGSDERDALYAGWKRATAAALSWARDATPPMNADNRG